MKQGKSLSGFLIIGAILIAIFAIYGFAGIFSVTLDSPADNTWSASGDVNFNCTAVLNATETDLGNITLRIWAVNGVEVTHLANQSPAFNSTTIEFPITGLTEAQYAWNCEAYNASIPGSSLMAAANRTLYVDFTAPTITLNAPTALNTTARTIVFNWTATDNLAVNFLCNLTFDGVGNATVMVTNGSLNSTTVANMPDGNYVWGVTCWDPTNATANTASSSTGNLAVDNLAPSNIAPAIANNTNFSSSTVYLNWTTTDATSTVVNCSLVVDGVRNLTGWYAASASGAAASQAVNNLSEGYHAWYVNCTDIVGNANTTGTFNDSGYNFRAFYVDVTPPTPSLSISSALIYTLDSETITCSASHTRDTNPSASFTVKKPDDTYSTDLDGTFTDTAQAGTYTVRCTATDYVGHTAYTESTFTVNTPTSSGGSSSSSASTSTTLSVSPGTTAKVRVSDSNIPITEVQFEVKESASNVRVTVESLSGKPSGIDTPNGGIYKYLQITKTNLDDATIKNAKISFFVTKEWLDDNGFSPSDIKLQRYTTKWVLLPVKVESSDANKVYFEATSSGFSYFAITANKPAEATPAEEETNLTEDLEVAPIAAAIEEQAEKVSLKALWITIGVLLVLFLAVLGYRKKHVLVFWREPTDKERQQYVRGEFLKRKKQQSFGSGRD
ncbi:MAG: PGF-pre-PGF domain-containing protein [Candidatus Nanoarchaeia archaeon]|nr:PGF-pre-PGF domain-containing protein [Candidatus Nanoarchaeia archaeon]